MQVCRRSARPGELDHELLWLLVSIGGLAAVVVWLRAGLPWPHCLFLALTGHPCVSCGATRAALQFFQGHFLQALLWNPLAFVGLCAVSLFDAYAAAVLVTGWPRLRMVGLTNKERTFIRIGVISILALNWIYLLTRPVSYA